MDENRFENYINVRTFRMDPLFKYVYEESMRQDDIRIAFEKISSVFEQKKLNKIIKNLIRNIFLIEAVNKEITSTKMTVRWKKDNNQFYDFSINDVRGAKFNDCSSIFEKLVIDLAKDIEVKDNIKLINLFLDNSLVSYELPLDYINTNVSNKLTTIHNINNISWNWSECIFKTIKLRSEIKKIDFDFKLNEHKYQLSKLLFDALRKKIEINTYKTGRALTGIHKTNREKRWESHPESVQFASRTKCIEIEFLLLNQLINFDGFPSEVYKLLVNENIITQGEITCCPITKEKLIFDEYIYEQVNPLHGQSKYQIGHLNPLKKTELDSNISGHDMNNISWISADGNRIQGGERTLKETVTLLKKIWKNYNFH